jgi:hypothetical protein
VEVCAIAVERASRAQSAEAKPAEAKPYFTRKWQDHQKALEIKTGLVSDMGESISDAVMTGRFISAGLVSRSSADPRADQRAFNDGYRAWTTSNASIGAKLQAYFGADLGSQWRSFSNVVTDYFQLSANPGRGRAEQVQEILSYPQLPPFVRLNDAERAPSWSRTRARCSRTRMPSSARESRPRQRSRAGRPGLERRRLVALRLGYC